MWIGDNTIKHMGKLIHKWWLVVFFFFFGGYQPTLDVRTAQIGMWVMEIQPSGDPAQCLAFWIGLVNDNLATNHNNKGEFQAFYSSQGGLYEIFMDFHWTKHPGMPDVATYILTSGWFSTRDIVVSVAATGPHQNSCIPKMRDFSRTESPWTISCWISQIGWLFCHVWKPYIIEALLGHVRHGESMHIHWLGLLCPFKMDFPTVKNDHEKNKATSYLYIDEHGTNKPERFIQTKISMKQNYW